MDVKDAAARILGRKTDIMSRRSLHPVLRERIETSACKCSDGRVFASLRGLSECSGRPFSKARVLIIKTDLDFDKALSLIEELSRGLTQANASASELSRWTIQRASDFLVKHGLDNPKFE